MEFKKTKTKKKNYILAVLPLAVLVVFAVMALVKAGPFEDVGRTQLYENYSYNLVQTANTK